MNADTVKVGGVNGVPVNDFICTECKGIITKVPCVVHDEVYESGHKDNCSFNLPITANCKFE